MFRNNYDNDSVTLYAAPKPPAGPAAPQCFSMLTQHSSPQGRIFQIEYAAEAVKQGSVVVGIASKTHAVLCAIKVRPLTSLE